MALPIVRSLSPLRVTAGCTVVVDGFGFDNNSKVLVDGVEVNVNDYDEKSLEFIAPAEPGEHSVQIKSGNQTSSALRFVVVPIEQTNVWSLAKRSFDEFREVLIGLMPRGFAWYMGKDGYFWKLFSALGTLAVYIWDQFLELIKEMSPSNTTSFDAWEEELGLPWEGLAREEDKQRLAEIFRIARKQGGCSVAYFKEIASLFGVDVEIFEYWKNPEKFADINIKPGEDPNFFWMILKHTHGEEVMFADCNGTCNDYLNYGIDYVMEAVFARIKPAHTSLVFAYNDDIYTGYLLDDNNNYLTDDNGNRLTYEIIK